MSRPVEQAITVLSAAHHAVALTGAGISTPSGIPDFRGRRSGLWAEVDPLVIASIWAFHDRPEQFYRWIQPLIVKLRVARPNVAHTTLALLEQRGLLTSVITQNIDSLHLKAGSRRVLEIHGHTRTASCLDCACVVTSEPLWSAVLDGGQPPPCPACGGLLKPDVVLFGEPLPYETISAAQHETLVADVMLIIGSSLEVMPAADLPLLARRRGAATILINLTPTPLDKQMDVVIREDVVKTMQQLRHALVG
jgi:NAD-dependent deacetylase